MGPPQLETRGTCQAATRAESGGSRAQKKLGYKEQRELEQLPARIEELENRQAELNALINSSGFFQNDKDKIRKTLDERQALEENLTAAYMRWDELESAGG